MNWNEIMEKLNKGEVLISTFPNGNKYYHSVCDGDLRTSVDNKLWFHNCDVETLALFTDKGLIIWEQIKEK